jgi:hypothetical protein
MAGLVRSASCLPAALACCLFGTFSSPAAETSFSSRRHPESDLEGAWGRTEVREPNDRYISTIGIILSAKIETLTFDSPAACPRTLMDSQSSLDRPSSRSHQRARQRRSRSARATLHDVFVWILFRCLLGHCELAVDLHRDALSRTGRLEGRSTPPPHGRSSLASHERRWP